MHITLRQLEVFCAVAQCGSTVAAAPVLALSQSAASAALQQLERGLGVRLFERLGRGLRPNDAGRALLPEALALLERARGVQQAFAAADNSAGALPVRLRIAASTTIGNYALAPVLAQLARQHPAIGVDLQIANTREVGEAVLALRADLGLIEGSSHWPGLALQPWLRDELVIVAAGTHALAQAARVQPLDAAALRGAHWLLREPGSGTREMVEHALLPHLHQFAIASTLGSSEAIARCAAQGLGLGCLSRLLVRALVEAGELVVLPTTLPRMWRHFSLVQRRGAPRSRALAAFIEACHSTPIREALNCRCDYSSAS